MASSYTIRHGDTLSAIARRNGISLQTLLDWNPVFRNDPKYQGGNKIWAGGTVYLTADNPRTSGGGGGAPAPAPEPPPVQPPPAPNPPPITPPSTPNPPTQQQAEDALKGPQRDAYVALKGLFEGYGLGSLAPKILEYVQQGYGADTIAILLQRTDEYKRRFAANETRRAAGLQVLSPQEYLATEQAYRQLMRTAGLPEGFYDQPEDFTGFLSKDVSPTELKTRIDIASQATAMADPQVKQALARMGISGPSVTAYFLDPNRATTLIQKQLATAQIGGAALANNLQFDQGRAEQLALNGITQEQARQGYGAISGFLGDAQRLAKIYGDQYDQATAEAEVFGQSGTAQQKRKSLASQERAQFQGSTGAARGGLGVSRR